MVPLLNKGSSMRRWWLLQGFELPRVDKWLNCRTATFSDRYPDAKFNYRLKDLFLLVLTWGVINIMLYHDIPQFMSKVIILIEVCAAVVLVTVMKTMMKTMGLTTPAKTDEVRSVSSPPPLPPPVVQHV